MDSKKFFILLGVYMKTVKTQSEEFPSLTDLYPPAPLSAVIIKCSSSSH